MSKSIYHIAICCEQVAVSSIYLKDSYGLFHKILVHRLVQIHFKQYFLQHISRGRNGCMLIALKVTFQNNGYFFRTKKCILPFLLFPHPCLFQGLRAERYSMELFAFMNIAHWQKNKGIKKFRVAFMPHSSGDANNSMCFSTNLSHLPLWHPWNVTADINYCLYFATEEV